MKALILLGGVGSRLRPFTLETPKPLLSVLNRPFFSYQLDQLKKHGVKEVVLGLGYRAAHFRRHLGDGRRWGMRFVYSLETTPLGTGGAMRKALPHLAGPTFVLNGDILSDLDLGRLRRFHVAQRSQATLALVRVDDPSQYGLIETDRKGKILRFIEKPNASEATHATINAGFYLFEPEIFQQIPDGQAVSIEREVFPRLVKSGYSLYGFLHNGYWIDMGTLRSYWKIHMDVISKRTIHAADFPRQVARGIFAPRNSRVARTVSSSGTAVIGPNCRIGEDVVFEGNVCIGARCVIADNAHVTNSVVQEGVRIGEHSRVESSLLGKGCRIGSHNRVGPYVAIAHGSQLGDYTQMASTSWEEDGV